MIKLKSKLNGVFIMLRARGLCGPLPQKTKSGKAVKGTGNAYSAGVKS